MNYKKYLRGIIISLFLAVPFLSSFISMIHMAQLFQLGNAEWISILLSVVYEIGALAAFITPFVFKRINRPMIFSVFVILLLMQLIGNLYYSFAYVNEQLKMNPNWLSSFQELATYFFGNDKSFIKILLAAIIAIPIPIISLLFLKSTLDYIDPDKNENVAVILDQPKVEPIQEPLPEVKEEIVNDIVSVEKVQQEPKTIIEDTIIEDEQILKEEENVDNIIEDEHIYNEVREIKDIEGDVIGTETTPVIASDWNPAFSNNNLK